MTALTPERLAEIRERAERPAHPPDCRSTVCLARGDRECLLAEVRRLTAENAGLRRVADAAGELVEFSAHEGWNVCIFCVKDLQSEDHDIECEWTALDAALKEIR